MLVNPEIPPHSSSIPPIPNIFIALNLEMRKPKLREIKQIRQVTYLSTNLDLSDLIAKSLLCYQLQDNFS